MRFCLINHQINCWRSSAACGGDQVLQIGSFWSTLDLCRFYEHVHTLSQLQLEHNDANSMGKSCTARWAPIRNNHQINCWTIYKAAWNHLCLLVHICSMSLCSCNWGLFWLAASLLQWCIADWRGDSGLRALLSNQSSNKLLSESGSMWRRPGLANRFVSKYARFMSILRACIYTLSRNCY